MANNKKNFFENLSSSMTPTGFQSVMEKAQSKISDLTEKVQNTSVPNVPTFNSQQDTTINQGSVFCSNCGTKLNEGAKFCHGCGSPVGSATSSVAPPIPSERQQEYAGKVLKCPHCGGIITESTAICPDCGMQLTGRTAVSSVQEFKDQLMSIEMSRKKSKFMDVYAQAANPADTQKLSLIRSFPIPNTIDDIQEFMLLAVANIDSKLSKNSAGGKFNSFMNSGNVNLTMQKTLSDAWISKMQQAYQKAEIMFPNEPVFKYIQKIYFDKMKELKIKIK